MSRIRIAPLAWCLVLAAALGSAPSSRAQSLDDILSDAAQAYAEAYVEPIVDGFGVGINSGLSQGIMLNGGLLPLVDVYVGVRLVAGLVPEESRSFSDTIEIDVPVTGSDGERYTINVPFTFTDAPTVFGRTDPGIAVATVNERLPGNDGVLNTADDVIIDETVEFELLPGLTDTPVAPLPIPEIGVGSLFGTSLTIRALPSIDVGDYGTVQFLGLGVQHRIDQYIPLFPVRISAGVMVQSLTIADDDQETLRADAVAAHVSAARVLGPLALYGGLQVERTTMDIEYTYVDQSGISVPVSYSETASTKARATLGGNLRLGPVNINADGSIGAWQSVSVGVGVSL